MHIQNLQITCFKAIYIHILKVWNFFGHPFGAIGESFHENLLIKSRNQTPWTTFPSYSVNVCIIFTTAIFALSTKKVFLRLQLHGAIYRPDSFVLMPRYCANLKAIRYESMMPVVRLELATPGLQTQCSSHWATQLKSYCWEGVEFIQLVYCIIIYLSFLNCDWLLIREVQWFCWTQELLVQVEKFTVRMPVVRPELATPGLQTQCSSHWATQLKSYCWEGVEFIQLVYCIIIYLSFLNCDWLLSNEKSITAEKW